MGGGVLLLLWRLNVINARMVRIEGANILETVEVEMKGCRQVSTEFSEVFLLAAP